MTAVEGAIERLTALGYQIAADGHRLRLRYERADDPPAEAVVSLLAELRAHKAEAMAWLRELDAPDPAATLQHCNTSPPDSPLPDREGVREPLQSPLQPPDDTATPEVAWRVDAMRAQLPATGPIPFLVARPVPTPVPPGACLSCGEALDAGDPYRCGACSEAVRRVLSEGASA